MDDTYQNRDGKDTKFRICGQEIEIQEASEPTDIIWENRHFSQEDRKKKRIVVYFSIVLLLIVSAGIIYLLSSKQDKLKTKYPQIICKDQFDDDYNIDRSNSSKGIVIDSANL